MEILLSSLFSEYVAVEHSFIAFILKQYSKNIKLHKNSKNFKLYENYILQSYYIWGT